MTIPETSLDNPDHVYLHGLALKNYRGIGEDFVFMPNFGKFNIFIGPNNAGKSTVLNFISRHLPVPNFGRTEAVKDLSPLEKNLGGGNVEFAIALSKNKEAQHVIDNNNAAGTTFERELYDVINAIDEDFLWYKSMIPFYGNMFEQIFDEDYFKKFFEKINFNTWSSITYRICNQNLSISHEEALQFFRSFPDQSRLSLNNRSISIPAIRKIQPGTFNPQSIDGAGLIETVARLRDTSWSNQAETEKFIAINDFLRTVTSCPDAEIGIPYERDHFSVKMRDKILPLEDLGTGIQEVIIIAAACTITKASLVCIEEPEIHLHPQLQRELIRYLAAKTDNQYFIATHSSAFVDLPGASVYRVQLKDGKTDITPALTGGDKFEICADLGYRASDLLQTNAVIWVEGPSDRLYLNNWIASYRKKHGKPAFIDGIHYSIMFYGGRLLSHLTADDEAVDDFIALQRLNRNVAIVMDSDRADPDSPINVTKRRLSKEIADEDGAKGRGVAWVTKGREIENYLEVAPLEAALKDRYPAIFGGRSDPGPYGHALHFHKVTKAGGQGTKAKAGDTIRTEIDKVGVAHRLCSQPLSLGVLDVEERIGEIVELIERANT